MAEGNGSAARAQAAFTTKFIRGEPEDLAEVEAVIRRFLQHPELRWSEFVKLDREAA